MPRAILFAHRLLAAGLGLFIVSHLAIHLTALGGAPQHQAVLSSVQAVYRNPVVEPVLILMIAIQILIGARLVAHRWQQAEKGFWSWAQILSGCWLGFFLIAHVSAALSTRYFLDLETDFYWSAATLIIAPFKFAFFPYYALGILSVFLHLAAVLHFGWKGLSRLIPFSLIALGGVVATLILLAFSGALYPIDLPPENAAYFEKLGL